MSPVSRKPKAAASGGDLYNHFLQSSSQMKTAIRDHRQLGGVTTTLVNQRVYYMAIAVEPDAYTGVGFLSHSPGTFTGNNNNKVGLYSSDGAGTLTKVAASASDPTIWQNVAGGVLVPFTAPLVVPTLALYYIALLYCRASEVSPVIVERFDTGNVGGLNVFGSTQPYSCVADSNTDLPATQAVGGLGIPGGVPWVGLY